MITITLQGPKGLGKLSSLSEELKNNLFKGLQEGAELIERISKERFLSGPYPDKLTSFGPLRAGMHAYAGLSNRPGEIGRIVADARFPWYGRIHEQTGEMGGPGFVIKAKGSKPMHFFWKQRGIWRRAWKVTIPSRPFLRPAVMLSKVPILSILNRMISLAYKKASSKP